jgi:hypothetical protein
MAVEMAIANRVISYIGTPVNKMVEEFHRVFGHPVDREVNLPNKAEMKLRHAIIQEEVDELERAIENGDLVEIFDALGDIVYTGVGGFLHVGGREFDTVMAAIHVANMSKLCDSEEQARAYIDETTDEEGPLYGYKLITEGEHQGKCVLYHYRGKKAGKIAKGPNTHKPDLSYLLEKAKRNA